MLEHHKDTGAAGSGSRKTYQRSVSWSAADRSPSNPSSSFTSNHPRPQQKPFSFKSRSSLPPLQPLCISRRPVEEWPRPGSDDLGEWPQPPTPSATHGRPSPLSIKPLDGFDSPKDFQLCKDRLAFFDKECSRITDHIYLGSDAVARSREILRQNGITHVLNCVGFVCPEYFKNDLVYKTLWLHDSPSEDITSILYDVFDYFEDVREHGGRVLVHCCKGVSRSTALVIAYLMWRNGQSFEDAFQYVKAARGVTNPNMGFACQLLQCQKRVHAVPASPNSVLTMYRMAPHSPYDPLHLVPKMLNRPGPLSLDSRGTFIVHLPSAIYIWVGKNCTQVMLNHAKAAASQVVRYERAQGNIQSIDEGEEPSEFWDALANGPLLADEFDRAGKVKEVEGKDQVAAAISLGIGNKKVDEYDVDYEIFLKALSGGVVPPFPFPVAGSETRLPARESGWSRLRRKISCGVVKELVDSCNNDTEEHPRSPTDSWLSPSPPCGSPDSFSCYSNTSPTYNFKSPLPSPSDSSSLFTFSPASSHLSDLSFSSSQPSPTSSEFTEVIAYKGPSQVEKTCLPCTGTFSSLAEPFAAANALRVENACVPCKGSSPSLAARRGSNPPSLVLAPSVNNRSHSKASRSIVRSLSFSLPDLEEDMMLDIGSIPSDCKGCDESMFDTDLFSVVNEVQEEHDKEFCDLPSNCSTDREVTQLVLYRWPTMEKVEMLSSGILDSRSVFLLLVQDVKLGNKKPKILYVWVGCDVPFEEGQYQLISNNSTDKHSPAYWEKVACIFLNRLGLPMDVPIQVVTNGEAPEQLIDGISSFSFQQMEN
ncbi:protein-tyrosine-phosphatase MKP1-like isoform X2 [Telopea speciosissima]|uniref:protein-tyrosine-phosphatase MKP1-like isoform X2 n=1 Tax=Telopea speciosissima TaxID=54955 RepID=UPI001CC380C2|nr:protein-tyrosine-phosphatase MKP1-like isoform X2 [Telopea speciosissima]